MDEFDQLPERWHMKNVGAAGQRVQIGAQFFYSQKPAATKELIGERERIIAAVKKHQAYISFFNLTPLVAGIGTMALMERAISSQQSKPSTMAFFVVATISLAMWSLVWTAFSEKRKHRSQVIKAHRKRLVELDAEIERRPLSTQHRAC